MRFSARLPMKALTTVSDTISLLLGSGRESSRWLAAGEAINGMPIRLGRRIRSRATPFLKKANAVCPMTVTPPEISFPTDSLMDPFLTSLVIEWMIRRMCKRLLAALLILGWISLSGFDVVEDLDEAPGQVAVSKAPADGSSVTKRGGWGPLANNIVESANRTKQIDFPLATFASPVFYFDLLVELHRRSPLHKLYRVFLI